MIYIIGDTETTGLGPNYKDPTAPPKRAVEVALMQIDPVTLENLGEGWSLIDPECEIHPKAAEVHGITAEMVADAPTIEEYLELSGGPLEGEITLIGYRVSFDLPLLRPFGNIVKTFDLLPLAQTLVRDSKDHKLQTMREYFNLPGGEAHRAIGDVYTTHQLLAKLLELSGRSLEAHCATDRQIYQVMPWGKHSGTLLVNLPTSYKRWLLEEAQDIDPDLRFSLLMYYETDLVVPKPVKRTYLPRTFK